MFSAGITFTMAFSTLNMAVRTVLFPQVTALESCQEMNSYLYRIRKIASYYFVLAAVGIAALGSLQWLILGAEYRAALPCLPHHCVHTFVDHLSGVGHNAGTYNEMKPQIDAWVNVGRLGLMVMLAFMLIPSFHALGAAVAYAVPVLVGEIWMFQYVKRSAEVSR